MRKLFPLGMLLVLLAGATAAQAQDATGTLAVSFTVASSFQLVVNQAPGGVALTGGGTSAASADLGTVSYYGGCTTAGVTCTQAPPNLSVTTTFAVRVDSASSSSANYRLDASLAAADATNTWRVNTVTLSTTAQTVRASSAYGTDVIQNLEILVPNTAPTGAVSNTINLLAFAI